MAEKELAAHEPAGRSSSERSSPLAVISSPANPKTVLIVDDDRDFLNYLSVLFRDNSFETLTAVDGHEAVELASARTPDLIALDISMPGKPGVAAYCDLEEVPELAAIPVLLLTAVGESIDHFIEQCRQVPAPAAFVARPLDVDLLWEAVRGVLGAPSG
jgi:CheY-like chemotaxis protein